jgi:hypothetical protein
VEHRFPHRTIRQSHIGEALSLPPTTNAIDPAEPRKFPDRPANRECFHIHEVAADLKALAVGRQAQPYNWNQVAHGCEILADFPDDLLAAGCDVERENSKPTSRSDRITARSRYRSVEDGPQIIDFITPATASSSTWVARRAMGTSVEDGGWRVPLAERD